MQKKPADAAGVDDAVAAVAGVGSAANGGGDDGSPHGVGSLCHAGCGDGSGGGGGCGPGARS